MKKIFLVAMGLCLLSTGALADTIDFTGPAFAAGNNQLFFATTVTTIGRSVYHDTDIDKL